MAAGAWEVDNARTDKEAVVGAALDYFEGWYDADLDRVARALHPELVKRWVGDPPGALGATRSKEWLLDLVRQGGGTAHRTDDPIEVVVADIHRDVAAVVVRSREYREYLHLARTPEGWRVVGAFWQATEAES